MANSNMLEFSKNQVIFSEGDAANCMYQVVYGSVAIYANYGKENEKLLTILRMEAFFGEIGLLEGLPRTATAVAASHDTVIEKIDSESFGDFMQRKPLTICTMMQHMSSRLRGLTRDYMDVCRTIAKSQQAEDAGKAPDAETQQSLEKFAAQSKATV